MTIERLYMFYWLSPFGAVIITQTDSKHD